MILSFVLFQLLLSRWLFLSESQRFRGRGRFWGKCLFDLVSIPFVAVNAGIWKGVVFYVLVALLVNILLFVFERRAGKVCYGCRAMTLLLHVALVSLFYYSVATPYKVNMAYAGNVGSVAWFVVASHYLSMIFFCMKESNYVIRWFFEKYRIKVQKEPHVLSGLSVESGRIIGVLERLLLLFFIWHDALFAATVIIAIKGLARYNSMKESSEVAEYVVIGTFLSLLLVLIAWSVLGLFSGFPVGL